MRKDGHTETDRWTNMTKLIVVFRDFANVTRNLFRAIIFAVMTILIAQNVW